jgi:hypothetical protein
LSGKWQLIQWLDSSDWKQTRMWRATNGRGPCHYSIVSVQRIRARIGRQTISFEIDESSLGWQSMPSKNRTFETTAYSSVVGIITSTSSKSSRGMICSTGSWQAKFFLHNWHTLQILVPKWNMTDIGKESLFLEMSLDLWNSKLAVHPHLLISWTENYDINLEERVIIANDCSIQLESLKRNSSEVYKQGFPGSQLFRSAQHPLWPSPTRLSFRHT